MQPLKKTIKESVPYIALTNFKYHFLPRVWHSDVYYAKKWYKKVFNKELNLSSPETFNEKIIWLMLNDRQDFHTVCADKLAVREFFSAHFGVEGLIPLLYQTTRWRDINIDNLPDCPCVVKSNNGSGWYQIVRDKNTVDYSALRNKCKVWMHTNYYRMSNQWQYKNIKPCILVEQLLLTREGKLPNDFKLNFINGKLEFVYCSIDREGRNTRNIYDAQWNPLHFQWAAPEKIRDDIRGEEIPPPASFLQMVEIGSAIAKMFKYVRVDFYDVDGKLYYGEITLHHGGGLNIFVPEKWDRIWGGMLKLPIE